jgi:hypothetical protein
MAATPTSSPGSLESRPPTTRPALNGRIVVILTVAALFATTTGLCDGAEAGGRSAEPSGVEPRSLAPAPTIESVSQEAQREIRDCPDSAAISCVAAALTRYVEALRTVNEATVSERRAHRRRRHQASDYPYAAH